MLQQHDGFKIRIRVNEDGRPKHVNKNSTSYRAYCHSKVSRNAFTKLECMHADAALARAKRTKPKTDCTCSTRPTPDGANKKAAHEVPPSAPLDQKVGIPCTRLAGHHRSSPYTNIHRKSMLLIAVHSCSIQIQACVFGECIQAHHIRSMGNSEVASWIVLCQMSLTAACVVIQ